MEYFMYGVDQSRLLSADSCLVRNCRIVDVSDEDKVYLQIITKDSESSRLQQDTILCLSQRCDNSIQEGDIVVPYWILDVLGVSSGSNISVYRAHLKLLDPSAVNRILLIYKGRKSYRHWDEVATPSTFAVPGTWMPDWPSGITVKAVMKFLPLILQSKVMIHNNTLVLDILDVTMMFQVKLKCKRSLHQHDLLCKMKPADNVDDANQPGEREKKLKAVEVVSSLDKCFKIVLDSPSSSSNLKGGETKIVAGCCNYDETQLRSAVPENSQSLFLNTAYRRILLICTAAFRYNSRKNPTERPPYKISAMELAEQSQAIGANEESTDNLNSWNGVRSLLVCGPEGAGKSFFLSEIEQSLYILNKIENRNPGSDFHVLRLSAKNCDQKPLPSSTSSASLDFSPTSTTVGSQVDRSIRLHLFQCVHSLQTTGSSSTMKEDSLDSADALRVILLIDDLDPLLELFSNDEDGNENEHDKNSYRGTAAYYLRQLLAAIAIPKNSFDQIIVIGATRFSASTLPRSHLGAPEFESAIALGRPTPSDRIQMLKQMIVKSNIDLELLPQPEGSDTGPGPGSGLGFGPGSGPHPCGNLESNVSDWVERVSELTAGYLPGDLAGIVRRAAGIFLGQKSSFLESSLPLGAGIASEENESKSEFKWKSMLSVIASLPPKQLQKLDFITGGASEAIPLTWEDFCGYDEIKTRLKRLLRLSKKEKEKEKEKGKENAPDRSPKSGVVVGEEAEAMLNIAKGINMGSIEDGVVAIDKNTAQCLSGDSEVVTRTSEGRTEGPAGLTDGRMVERYGPSQSLQQCLQLPSSQVRGIVLHGPSGCGKSFIARVIAAEAKMNFVSVKSADLLSKYFGQTEASIRAVFRQVRAAAPCVLFFDEFDVLAYKRGTGDDSSGGGGTGLQTRVLSTFLNELDGIVAHDCVDEGGILVLAACSDIGVLDDALLRPGRLQHHIELELPNRTDIEDILKGRINKLKCSDDVCVRTLGGVLVERLDFCVTGADVENVCRRAMISRIREHVMADPSNGGNTTGLHSGDGYGGGNTRRNEAGQGDATVCSDISIGMRNFFEALKECFPSLADLELNSNLKIVAATDTNSKPETKAAPFVWSGDFSGGMNLHPI